jgi:hypothetical protein
MAACPNTSSAPRNLSGLHFKYRKESLAMSFRAEREIFLSAFTAPLTPLKRGDDYGEESHARKIKWKTHQEFFENSLKN